MKKVSHLAFAIALGLGITACSSEPTTGANTQSVQAAKVSGVEKENFDPAVRFQDDLYYSVNGHWLANTPIPADKSAYGTFSILYEHSQSELKQIIEAAAAKTDNVAGSSEQKVGDFYASYMDTDSIEKLGTTPLKGQLAAIANVKTHDELVSLMGSLLINGSGIPLGFYVNNDAKKSTQYGVYVNQSGLTLPDRDYYLKDDEKNVAYRKALSKYVTDLMTLAGYKDAKRAAKSVADIEHFIAENQWSRVEQRDANKRYNKMSLAEVQKLTGGFDFDRFVKAVGLAGKTDEVIIGQPSYFEKFGAEFNKIPVSAWQDYLAFHYVDSNSSFLSKAFVDLHFDFYSKTLRGVEEQKPRWKNAVDTANSVLGELVGQEYVKKNFTPEAKARMEGLIHNLLKAFEVSINNLEWMTPETKVAAQEKLSKFTYKIGYPDKWKDYTALEIKPDDLFGNIQRYSHFSYTDMINKLGQPIDRTEWHMTPQTVNAYYNPVMNEVVFPAAILQPPFFNMDADDAVNYGGIGAVIGHEISHGFDDQGAKYDGDGNLRNWWSEKDKQEFEKRGKQLSAQYSKFEPLSGKFVNGDLTLGENIGDLGGLTVSHLAYELSLQGKEAPVMDGLTGEQRFFISWSRVWARKYRDEEMVTRLLVDPHSPSQYRAMGTPRNVEAFYKAFDVKKDDGMYLAPEDRVKIW
ncbi:M13 family peptidase [Shewanella sp. AS1]|uniref:M13 family metallopeptidase n=1 Tax=Shewanella sp. AS1 TaxID=2907626 RepID=UPI001F398909|nr:M13-type metalloendopeptidase [Shewanella sp. AS1]MCE9679898.1 M13 family peptidase [Shewanella sp. AS1]